MKKDEVGTASFEYVDFNIDYKLGFSKRVDSYPLTEF